MGRTTLEPPSTIFSDEIALEFDTDELKLIANAIRFMSLRLQMQKEYAAMHRHRDLETRILAVANGA